MQIRTFANINQKDGTLVGKKLSCQLNITKSSEIWQIWISRVHILLYITRIFDIFGFFMSTRNVGSATFASL
jgi:hypothetical protein